MANSTVLGWWVPREQMEALLAMKTAARVLDALFGGNPGFWHLGSQRVDDVNVEGALLVLHDTLNDVTSADDEVRERAQSRHLDSWGTGWPAEGTVRYRILDELWLRFRNGRHGATREELARTLRVTENTIRPRCVELIRGGWIGPAAVVESEDARFADETRKTKCKKDAGVLVLTDATIARMAP